MEQQSHVEQQSTSHETSQTPRASGGSGGTSSYGRSVGKSLGYGAASAALSPGSDALSPVQYKGEAPDVRVPVPQSGGSPLPGALQHKMERSFGADFSGVRVHQGGSAESMGGVRAAAQGSNITFASGEYDPGSRGGQELIGHELTHVVHQAAGRVQPTAQAKGGMVNTDPGLEAEADRMGALAAAGQPARVAGASAVGGARSGGQVAQFNLITTVKDKVDKAKDKRKEKKQERRDAKTANRNAIDAARDAVTGAVEVAATAEATLERKLAEYADAQLSSNKTLVKRIKEHGAEHAKNRIGAGTQGQDDAAAFAKAILKKSRAHHDAITEKAGELAAPVANAAAGDLLAAARAGYDGTSGSGDAQALVDKAKARAVEKAASKGASRLAKGKKSLDRTLEAQKATIEGDLKGLTAGKVEAEADAELTERNDHDVEVQRVVDPAAATGLSTIRKVTKAWLVDKLGVHGVALTRSDKLKDFRSQMGAAGKAKARKDARKRTRGKNEELRTDAEKRTRGKTEPHVKDVLKELAVEGRDHSVATATAEAKLKAAASKAAWGSIRDGGRGKSAAKTAVAAALPAVQADVTAEARTWKNAFVKAQTRLDEAKERVEEKVHDARIGKDAGDASKAKEAPVDAIVGRVVPPGERRVEDEITKHLTVAIGAKGAGWWRSDAVRAYRGKLKRVGRRQAYKDVDATLNADTELRDATKAYMEVAGKDVAHRKAKGSVNAEMKEFAKTGAAKAVTDTHVAEALGKVARKKAFKAFRDKKPKREAKAIARDAVLAAVPAQVAAATATADAWKAELFAGTEISDAKSKVRTRVKNDQVGERSVKEAIEANTTAEGMAAIGRIADLAAPERGDSAKIEVELKIPIPESPAYVFLKVIAEAERGVTVRKNGAPDGAVDASSLKVGAQINIGGGAEFWGLQLDGSIGFFVRAQAMDTQKTFQALNYGAYRSACQINDGIANWWGGSSKSKDRTHGHGKGATQRAEMWAAMVEENVFMRENPKFVSPTHPDPKKRKKYIVDEDAFVDIGGALNAHGKLKAHVVDAEAQGRGELYAHYDGAVIKKALKRAKRKGKITNPSDVGLAKAGNTKDDAKDRRRAIKPKTGGGFVLEAKAAFKILEQLCEFAGKLEINTEGWGAEISAGLKLDTAGTPTAFERIASGIVSSAASSLRTLIGLYQNSEQTAGEQVNRGIGGLLRTGEDAESILDAATGGGLTTALGKAYEVEAGKSDQVNETVSNSLNDLTGSNEEIPDNVDTKAGTSTEVMLAVVIQINDAGVNFQIKQIKARKIGGQIGNVGVDAAVEKQQRLAMFGVIDGHFHAEGLGFGTTRRNA